MLIRSIRLRNLLSFGPEAEAIELQPLNVIIGPNASGKSNLIEALHLLRSCATDLAQPIREGGGIGEYLWKGQSTLDHLEIEVQVNYNQSILRHELHLAETRQRMEVTHEVIDDGTFFEEPSSYILKNERGVFGVQDRTNDRNEAIFFTNQSIISQRRDPVRLPEMAFLSDRYREIRLFRDWQFGRKHVIRRPQQVDLPEDFLLEDASNLGLILHNLDYRGIRPQFQELLKILNEDFADFSTLIQGGTIQINLRDRYLDRPIPAARLSEGTLRFLCLAAVLLHPEPPPLVCLEEPETGLHPDLFPELARLLEDASTRTQVIVTTHSRDLVDAFTETPDRVLVAGKKNGSTRFDRLASDHLKQWLEKYSLGELWKRGQLGGTRF